MKKKLIIQNDLEVHHIREAKNAVLNTGISNSIWLTPKTYVTLYVTSLWENKRTYR